MTVEYVQVTRTQIGGPTGNPDGVFGALQVHVDDDAFPISLNLCTCERPWLGNKPLVSCIPDGDYVLKKHTVQSGYFKGLETYEITGISGRSGCLLHPGKVDTESEGCILEGEAFDMRQTADAPKYGLIRCEEAHAKFMAAMGGQDNVPFRVRWRSGLEPAAA